jgi:hypothetical protein
MNILTNCSADNPTLIRKVLTRWLRLVCGMLRKQWELLDSFFFWDHKFTAICNTHWHSFLNVCPIRSKPRTFTIINYKGAYCKHFYVLITRRSWWQDNKLGTVTTRPVRSEPVPLLHMICYKIKCMVTIPAPKMDRKHIECSASVPAIKLWHVMNIRLLRLDVYLGVNANHFQHLF